VRLIQGRDDARTGYGDPVDAAREWIDQGAQFLHVVDLDGAFCGTKADANRLRPFERIVALGVPVQWGGGIRTIEDIKIRIAIGARRVVLGTIALTDPETVREACAKYPDRIACGIDARGGKAAIRGWTEETAVDALDLARSMRALGVAWTVYTDVSRDGMLTGPNVDETARFVRESGLRVIGSGGVGSTADIAALKCAGCEGAIIGKALYERRFTLREAMDAALDCG
jgi:phosphoribosylformimino-5-aminoimidazole carboxamide ribotide isomerase